MQAPFPWFGGKSRAAPLIWERFGDVQNYCEPFFGSGAVLLNRPHPPGIETVNDKDSFVSNVFRALQADPETVAKWCDWPPNEADLHARHTWLLSHREEVTTRLMGDPDYCDAKIAGWWLWGIALWIGSGWCSGNGPWQSVDGQLVKGNAGQGVHRQLLHLGNAGQGVHRQLLHLGDAGKGVHRQQDLYAWFGALQERLRHVRVCCGEWHRILGPSATTKLGMTAVLMDPPYSMEEDRGMGLYAEDCGQVAHDVRAWCLANGHNPFLRIALCGYGEVHDELLTYGWSKVEWMPNGGMGNLAQGRGRANKQRERLWFSPHCLTPNNQQLALL